MLEAVLFDWGDTLMAWEWQDELVEAGHRAGLESLGNKPPVEVDGMARYLREHYERLFAPEALDEVEYPEIVRELLGTVGVELSDGELRGFLEAEHAAWAPARRLAANTHPLLDALRTRGLRLGLVSNTFDPAWLLRRDLGQMGVAERLDVAVFSSEVGKRKPHPAIFERALEALGVAAADALFVGDRLREDVGGAGALGMTTVQALWFAADAREDAPEPDYRAFTQMDVLNVARRLSATP